VCVCENTFFSLFIFTVLRLWRLFYGRRRRMIIKWIREFPGHGRQEKRIYSGDAYNPPRRRRPSCGLLVRFRSVVFFSFLIYFSAVICLSDSVRPYNNNKIIHWHISVKSCARAAVRHLYGGSGGGLYPAFAASFS